jgi:hypothetical protein
MLILPSELPAMKRDLFESKIIDEPSEPPHHCSIVIRVVLVFMLINQIEVSCNHPRPQADTSHLSELLQECYFSSLPWGPYTQAAINPYPHQSETEQRCY